MTHDYRIRDGEDFDAFAKRCGRMPVNLTMLNATLDVLIKVATAQKARIEVLETRCKALEGRPSTPVYRGVYEAGGKVYEAGECVTHKGSLWIANQRTMLCPDEERDGAREWTLCVKRGRDGRDGKDLR